MSTRADNPDGNPRGGGDNGLSDLLGTTADGAPQLWSGPEETILEDPAPLQLPN